MTKHSSGKWSIVPIAAVGRGEEIGRANIVVWDEDGLGYETIVPATFYDDDLAKANAELISASPDLFYSLKSLVSAVKMESPAYIRSCIRDAEIALKKAGEKKL